MDKDIKEVCRIVKSVLKIAREKGKISLFSIATTANIKNKEIEFPSIRETEKTVCGNVLLKSKRLIGGIIKELDGVVDIILIDVETKTPEVLNLLSESRISKSRVLTFKPNDLTVDAADAFIAQLICPLNKKRITILGSGNIGSKLALKLVERGADVYLYRRNKTKLRKIVKGLNAIKSPYIDSKVYYTSNEFSASKKADVLIGTTPGIPIINKKIINLVDEKCTVIDIGNGTIFPDAVEEIRKRKLPFFCLSMKPGYYGALETILQTEKQIRKQKSKNMGSFSIMTEGIFGKRGDVIVDDVENPTRILAVSDGMGDILQDKRLFRSNILAIKNIIKVNYTRLATKSVV